MLEGAHGDRGSGGVKRKNHKEKKEKEEMPGGLKRATGRGA